MPEDQTPTHTYIYKYLYVIENMLVHLWSELMLQPYMRSMNFKHLCNIPALLPYGYVSVVRIKSRQKKNIKKSRNKYNHICSGISFAHRISLFRFHSIIYSTFWLNTSFYKECPGAGVTMFMLWFVWKIVKAHTETQ